MKTDSLEELRSVFETAASDLNSSADEVNQYLSKSRKASRKVMYAFLFGLVGFVLSLSFHLFLYEVSKETIFLLWAIRNSLLLPLLLAGLAYLAGKVAEKKEDAGLKKRLSAFQTSEFCIWKEMNEKFDQTTIPEEVRNMNFNPFQGNYYERLLGMYMRLEEQCKTSKLVPRFEPEEQNETGEDRKDDRCSKSRKGAVAAMLLLVCLCIYLCYDLVFGSVWNQYFDIVFLLIIPWLFGLLLTLLLFKDYSFEKMENLRAHYENVKELLKKFQEDLDELDSFYETRPKDVVSRRDPYGSGSELLNMPETE